MLSFRLEYPSGYHSSASLFRSGLTSPLHLSYMCGHMCFRMFHSGVIRCPATAPVPLGGNILDAPPVRARDERGPSDFLRSYHVLPRARAVACAPALALWQLLVGGLFPLPFSLCFCSPFDSCLSSSSSSACSCSGCCLGYCFRICLTCCYRLRPLLQIRTRLLSRPHCSQPLTQELSPWLLRSAWLL